MSWCFPGERTPAQGRKKPLWLYINSMGSSPFNELPVTVDVFQNHVQQEGPLLQSFFDVRPFLPVDQKRDNILFPGPADTGRIPINIIGDTVFLNHAENILIAADYFLVTQLVIRGEKGLPVGTQLTICSYQFII